MSKINVKVPRLNRFENVENGFEIRKFFREQKILSCDGTFELKEQKMKICYFLYKNWKNLFKNWKNFVNLP